MRTWSFGSQMKGCINCGHAPMRHYSYFNRFVSNPIKYYGYVGLGRDAMLILKREVLDKVLLRRTKDERAADVKLPSLTIEVRELDMSEEVA